MRLFTGFDLPEEVLRNLEALLTRLRPTARIQWSPAANLHITTKFIGAWPDERLAELTAALSRITLSMITPSIDPLGRAIGVHIRKLGFYPNPHAPRVLWCGIEAPGLDALAAETDRVAAAIGIPAETRPFSPHLTLARIPARIKAKADLQPLREAIAALPSLDFGRFEAHRFFLYQSLLRPTGSVYTKLAEFPLSK
jgi:RNA 2',3'-cyclic 3'-phosphodiesterase